MNRRFVNDPLQAPVGPTWSARFFALCLSVVGLMIMPTHLMAQTSRNVGSTRLSPDLAAISTMLAEGKPANMILDAWKAYATRRVQAKQPLDVQATLQQVTGQAHAQLKARADAARKRLADKMNTLGDDAQLANVEMQNILQKQQQALQMMSNISKMMHDTAMSVIRKIGG